MTFRLTHSSLLPFDGGMIGFRSVVEGNEDHRHVVGGTLRETRVENLLRHVLQILRDDHPRIDEIDELVVFDHVEDTITSENEKVFSLLKLRLVGAGFMQCRYLVTLYYEHRGFWADFLFVQWQIRFALVLVVT